MRATIIAATTILLGLSLAGCDNPPSAPAVNPQAANPPCNCTPNQAPDVQAAATSQQVTHRHHRHWSSYASRHSYQESESYSSGEESQSTDRREYDQGYRGDNSQEASSEQNVWVDGYGRSHYVQVSDATVSVPPDTRERRAPWAHYDEKCDDKDK